MHKHVNANINDEYKSGLWFMIHEIEEPLLIEAEWRIYASVNLIIGSDNGLSPGRRQAIIWTNDGILLIWPWGTTFSEILIEIHIFSFKKVYLKMSYAKCRPFCLCLNVLTCEVSIQCIYGRRIWSLLVCRCPSTLQCQAISWFSGDYGIRHFFSKFCWLSWFLLAVN